MKTNILFCVLLFCIYQGFSSTPVIIKEKKSTLSYDQIIEKINTSSNSNDRVKFSKQYLEKAKKDDNVAQIMNAYWYLSSNCTTEIAFKYCDTMLYLSKNKHKEYLPNAYLKKGQVYYNDNQLDKALDLYLLAYKALQGKPSIFKNRLLFSIGIIKSSQGLYKEALSIFLKCLSLPEMKKDINTYYAVAEMYMKLDEIELSEKYTTLGIKLCEESNNQTNKIGFISNRGKNFYKRKNYEKALIDLINTLEPFKNELKDFSNYSENCYYIGKCYLGLNNNEKATSYFKKVDSVFTKEKDLSLETFESIKFLIDYYKNKNDTKKALFYTDQFISANSLANKQYKYITEKINKDYDVPELIANKEKLINGLKTTHYFSMVTILVMGLLIIILVYFFSKYKKKSKKVIELQKKLFDDYKQKQLLEKNQIDSAKEDFIPNESKKTKPTFGLDENIVNKLLGHLKEFEDGNEFIVKNFTIETLATEFNTNSNYLYKVITEYKKMSFPNYINNLKIDYIINRLENEKKIRRYTIKAIAECAGYNNVQSFSRAFGSRTKMTPSSFIKELNSRDKEV